MKSNNHHHHHQYPKLKTPLFSTCGLFRHCSHTTLSPTAPNPPPLPLSNSTLPPPPSSPPPPPPPPRLQPLNKPESSSSSSSSSSASTSQSFTQWRFPLANSPLHPPNPNPPPPPHPKPGPLSSPLVFQTPTSYQELFHLAELRLTSGSEPDRLAALHLLERSLVPNPPSDPVCPPGLMRAVVVSLRDEVAVKPATKILLALCLAEGNRRVAVEAGAVGVVVEVAMELEGPSAERALAALELACTVAEGVAELRAHALAVPVMVAMMGKMAGRGKEYAISALAVIYGGGGGCGEDGVHAPAEEVANAVALALQQGGCTDRGRRKGSQLLKALQGGGPERSDLVQDGDVDGDQRL